MNRFPQLQQALTPVLAWTKNAALPFWGSVGVDPRGGFHERLDLEGRPILAEPKRLMVQGRQLYVFSSAALLGWYPDGRQLADRCIDYILRAYYKADGKPGWVYSVGPDGAVASATRDAYAHAFVLFGLAWYHRLTRDPQVLAVVDATLAFLDEALLSDKGGYRDAVPAPDAIRRQNPHMHLFEAYLALHDATGRAVYLDRAAALFDLFAAKFFQPAGGTLCEYLTEELRPLPDQQGRIVEPGHHYEWIWLLRQFQHLSGRDVGTYAAALYAFADRYGWDRDGFIVDELDISGAILAGSRRVWPLTEGVKANIVEGECGRDGVDERAVRCLVGLQEAFLARPIAGAWTDRIGAGGEPAAAFIPASTLYHLFGAVTAGVEAAS